MKATVHACCYVHRIDETLQVVSLVYYWRIAHNRIGGYTVSAVRVPLLPVRLLLRRHQHNILPLFEDEPTIQKVTNKAY